MRIIISRYSPVVAFQLKEFGFEFVDLNKILYPLLRYRDPKERPLFRQNLYSQVGEQLRIEFSSEYWTNIFEKTQYHRNFINTNTTV